MFRPLERVSLRIDLQAGKRQTRTLLDRGQKGWQFSFYDEVLNPQWKNLRERLVAKYGKDRKFRDFPKLKQVPMGDPGGFITDSWDLSDRLLMLTVQSFKIKDCCTNKMVEYSCCTLLIQPKQGK